MRVAFLTIILTAACAAWAQVVDVPNASFEDGTDQPLSWTLTGGEGKWIEGGTDGKRAIAVTGNGEDVSAWLSSSLALQRENEGRVYQLRFQARDMTQGGADGGTPFAGTMSCNRDLGAVPHKWTSYSTIIAVPNEYSGKLPKESLRLQFGQRNLKGTIAFDRIELQQVTPVYRLPEDDFELGDGESIDGNRYRFCAPLRGASGNHARPLLGSNCRFDTDRWVFAPSTGLWFLIDIGQRVQTDAAIEIEVARCDSGELSIAMGTGECVSVQDIASIRQPGTISVTLPKGLLERTNVRRNVMIALFSWGSFEVTGITYTATVDGPPVHLKGVTQFLDERKGPDPHFTVKSLGDLSPRGANEVVLHVENPGPGEMNLRPRVRFLANNAPVYANETSATLKNTGGQAFLRIPYRVPRPGTYTMEISAGGDRDYVAETTVTIPRRESRSHLLRKRRE